MACAVWAAIRIVSISRKLCCILVQYGGCIGIKAQVHHSHQAEETTWDCTEQGGGQALVMYNGSRAAQQVSLQPLIHAQLVTVVYSWSHPECRCEGPNFKIKYYKVKELNKWIFAYNLTPKLLLSFAALYTSGNRNYFLLRGWSLVQEYTSTKQ